MPPLPLYDYVVLGAGSGGMASARRAATHNAKTALIEEAQLGGTCVNRGCIPKKLLYQAATVYSTRELFNSYQITQDTAEGKMEMKETEAGKQQKESGKEGEVKMKFDWKNYKEKLDAYILRLNGIYDNNLKKDGVKFYKGTGKIHGFSSDDKKNIMIKVGDETISAKKVLIATGSYPTYPKIPGAELGITSDDFFKLTIRPRRVLIIGAGYIALEFATSLAHLGSEQIHLCTRGKQVLTVFDSMLQDVAKDTLLKVGINLQLENAPTEIKKIGDDLEVTLTDGKKYVVDTVIWATGRRGRSSGLGCESIGVKVNDNGSIAVDEWGKTNVENVFSVGDVAEGTPMLTPVAIAAGRHLSERLFNKEYHQRFKKALSFKLIPTVVFLHPTTIGTCGMTEKEAREEYGDDIKIYESGFTGLTEAMTVEESELAGRDIGSVKYGETGIHKWKSRYKLICTGANEKIVGLHIIGKDTSEMLQGFAVAMHMGATKTDFDSTIAIHPTASEELVTMR